MTATKDPDSSEIRLAEAKLRADGVTYRDLVARLESATDQAWQKAWETVERRWVARAERAEGRLDKVRALCDVADQRTYGVVTPQRGLVHTSDLRRALDGQDTP